MRKINTPFVSPSVADEGLLYTALFFYQQDLDAILVIVEQGGFCNVRYMRLFHQEYEQR